MAQGAGRGLIRIGVSGWRYAPWRGRFYPRGLAQRRELEFASQMFATLEINGSFYSLQRPESWHAWHDQTPRGFVFSVKGPRFITHVRRLRDARVPLANFFASGVLALGDKLGPFLWQLPPNFRYDADRLERFLSLLPRDSAAARRLAHDHDFRLDGRDDVGSSTRLALRHALEVRHDSFVDPAFVAQLRRHGVALVVADTGGRWPDREDLTADFVYLRLHGPEQLYASGYTDRGLDDWARRIAAWSRGGQVRDAKLTVPGKGDGRPRDVYCYFDNDVKVHAPHDADGLATRLKQPSARGTDGRFDWATSPLRRPTPDR